MSKDKQVLSNGAMAFASLFSVGLSIVSTFGLCGLVGVKQNPVTSTLYLVLLGIGVDDSYVIMGEYTRTKGTPKERVVKALTKAGTSIAVTSTTDIIAFAAGVSSSLPALADFCIFASIGILFDFFYQCTFFCALLTLRARGTESNRPDWLCCIKVDPEATGCFGCSAPICSRKGKCVCCPCSWEGEDGESNSVTRSLLNKMTKFTLSPVGNGVVAVVTVGLLAGGVAGIPNLKRDFDIKWFTPDDDAYTETFDIADQYFPTLGGLPVYVYTKEGSYSQAHSDGSLSTLYQSAQSCSWVDSNIGNWYTDFTTDAVRSNNAKASDAAFASEVYSFINSVAGARFQGDVMFNKDSTGNVVSVDGTKAMYIAKPTKNGGEDIEMMNAVRDCVDGKALSSFPFNSPFLYFDGLAVVDTECIQNVVIACACVFVVALILLADLFAALLVLLMIGLVDICILGYMAHWELDFNSVTAINLVLAVGLAVDYAAHIMHKFLVVHGSGAERAMQAVDHIGASVFNGAFSTFLAVLPLGLSKSYVFQVFFKMWFMIIVFGVYFGVVVLPVLLKFASPIIGAQEPKVYETSTPTGSSVKPGNSEVNEATSKDGHYIGKPQDDPVTVSIR
jgi:predicted RND superfamily exporter protein